MSRPDTFFYEYDLNHRGDCIKITDANGHITNYEYDQYGNQSKVIIDFTGLNMQTSYDYDNLSRLTKVTDPENRIIQYTWNSWNKKIGVIYNNRTIYYTYDSRGRQTAIYDNMSPSRRTESTYNDFDQVIKEKRIGDGDPEINYTYDLAGNKTSMTNQRWKITEYTYDELNRPKTMKDPLNRITTYIYGNDGTDKPTEIDYPNGNETKFIYDLLYRLTKIENGNDVNSYTSYVYDEVGNRTSMTESARTTSYTYDDLNRLTSVTHPRQIAGQNFTLAYTYDYTGNRKTMTTNSPASSITYNYDNANRLTSAVHSIFGTASFTYDKSGNRKTLTYPNGVATTYCTYDTRNRVTNMTYKNKLGTVISNVNYTYDAAGNRLTMADELGTTNYEYDSLNQIKNVITPRSGTQKYIYDLAGNRTNYKDTNSEINYTYDNANEMLTAGRTNYVYDNSGNQIVKGDMTYEWDYLDRLMKVKKNSNTIAEFSYDPDGRRIQGQSTIDCQQSTVNYFYDDVNPIIETDSSGNVVKEIFSVNGEVIAKSQKPKQGTVNYLCYHLHDSLGSTSFVLDEAGHILGDIYYNPYGESWNAKGDVGEDIRYTGKEFEEEIGLYYFEKRWYDQEIGRFISPDPIEPLIYIYCANNPMRYIDENGLEWWDPSVSFAQDNFGVVNDIWQYSIGNYNEVGDVFWQGAKQTAKNTGIGVSACGLFLNFSISINLKGEVDMGYSYVPFTKAGASFDINTGLSSSYEPELSVGASRYMSVGFQPTTGYWGPTTVHIGYDSSLVPFFGISLPLKKKLKN